jgi:hypothetical protein
MGANRVTAVRFWMGAVVFGWIALVAWVRIASLIPWALLTGSSGSGDAPTNSVEVSVVFLLPLLGNVLVLGDARRDPRAMTLHQLQLLAWAGSIVAALLVFLSPPAISIWVAALTLILVATQLTLLSAVFATLAVLRSRPIA